MTHVTSGLTVKKRDQIGTGSCQISSRSVHPISHNARASQTHTDRRLRSAKLNPTLGNGVWATFRPTFYSLQRTGKRRDTRGIKWDKRRGKGRPLLSSLYFASPLVSYRCEKRAPNSRKTCAKGTSTEHQRHVSSLNAPHWNCVKTTEHPLKQATSGVFLEP